MIRLAYTRDLDAIVAIEKAACEMFLPWPDVYAIFSAIPSSPSAYTTALERKLVWVATLDSTVVGFAQCALASPWLHLDELDVLPAWGRRGIGTALVRAVIEQARKRGDCGVTLITQRDVPWNAPFYARLGFGEMAADAYPSEVRRWREFEEKRGLPRRVVMQREDG